MELLLPVVPEVVDLIAAVLPVLHPLLHPLGQEEESCRRIPGCIRNGRRYRRLSDHANEEGDRRYFY